VLFLTKGFGTRRVHATDQLAQKIQKARLPTRHQQLAALRSKSFDVLVIGGGATGCGVALDAISRGLVLASKCLYVKLRDQGSKSFSLIIHCSSVTPSYTVVDCQQPTSFFRPRSSLYETNYRPIPRHVSNRTIRRQTNSRSVKSRTRQLAD